MQGVDEDDRANNRQPLLPDGQGIREELGAFNGNINAVYSRAFDAWVEAYDFRKGAPNDGVFQPFVKEMREVVAKC